MADPFSLADYLQRVGIDVAVKPDLPTLMAIHAAHVDAIPFEALDSFLGRPVKLDLEGIQQKILYGRRGGYCFEQNTLLKAALEVIGFKVTGLAGRVRWMAPPGSPLGPRSHMLLKIDLPAGPYLADVGFGAFLLDRPLQLQSDLEQDTAMGKFLLTEADGLFTLNVKLQAAWRAAYVFNLEPQVPADYELANWYTSTNPGVPFVRTLILERLGRNRRYKLVNERYIVQTRDGMVAEERAISSAEELGQLLEQTFRISSPAPAQDIFARVCR